MAPGQVTHPQPTYVAPYPPPVAPPNGYHSAPYSVNMAYPGQAAWRGFADDMMNIPQHEYMHSANTLMTLEQEKQHMIGGLHIAPQHDEQQQGWPMVQYGHPHQ